MNDDPFNTPSTQKETIYVRPTPGGRPATPPASPAPPGYPGQTPGYPGQAAYPAQPAYPGHPAYPGQQPPASARPVPPPLPSQPVELPTIGWPPLLEAAAPLLLLLAQLRNTFTPPDPMALRQQVIGELQRFEAATRNAGLPQDTAYWARYALCASVDDLVLNTEWGNNSPWVRASLGSTYFQDVVSGEKFFQVLDGVKRDAARNLELLNLMYFCLSLGYQGQYRLVRRGPAELELLREEIYGILQRLRPPYEPLLSLRWLGIQAPYRAARTQLPIWVVAVVTAALLMLVWAGLYVLFLPGKSSPPMEQAEMAMPQGMPGIFRPVVVAAPRPAPVVMPQAEPAFILKLAFLQPEIDAHRVAVDVNGPSVRVTIFDNGEGAMFASGSDVLNPGYLPLMTRIGQAIETEPGQVTINGDTDRVPIHTTRFPSNYELSVARAAAAQRVVSTPVHDKSRFDAPAGYAATHPACTKDQSKACLAQNRRIEIILTRPPS